MTRLYEGMFVLDNQLVREDWNAAKAVVTSALEKHGATVRTARRWDERRLAYPIAKRNRGTFLLSYFDIDSDELPPLARDLELAEPVLRHLILQAETVPEDEVEQTKAETADDFVVPTPPPDDAPDEEELAREREREERDRERRERREARDRRSGPPSDKPAEAKPEAEAKDGDASAESKDGEAKTADAPAKSETENAEAASPAKEG